ncbi:hypothetical protein BM1_03310 [Bipolaris maydis]|nr:hypothetical protein BM1_03310 [Bipolaris maydis]
MLATGSPTPPMPLTRDPPAPVPLPCTNSEIAGANATPNNLAKLDPKQTCCLLAPAPWTQNTTDTGDRGRAMQRLEGR